jgi:site-specific DNA-cytosine methylase
MIIAGKEFVRIGEAAKILGVTEQTLRNWDSRGKLRPQRHPINGYRIYRIGEVRAVLEEFEAVQRSLDLLDSNGSPASEGEGERSEAGVELYRLPPCHWRPEVALDPKHRPQHWDAPSSTVRRDWRKYPQEAQVLDRRGEKYRRLTVDEIALIQGFDPSIARLEGLTDRERIASLGDAVPPPLAAAILTGIGRHWRWKNPTAIEICAGIGGLAEGSARVGLEHLLLVDQSEVCGKLLRNRRSWKQGRVATSDLRSVAFAKYRGHVGLLSGGPPCQPWSRSGQQRGHDDDRDLLGTIHEIVAAVEPEVFVFENVPGLSSEQNAPYLRALVDRLRLPKPELQYGVLVARLNAADYGVPQIRERLFIVGFRDTPAFRVSKSFDEIESLRTHQVLGAQGSKRPSWVTIGEAIGKNGDPGGWRRWIGH